MILKFSKSFFYQAFRREMTLQRRQLRVLLNASLLFFMILIFFPLAFPADRTLLRLVFPGLFWISILFSFFLSSEHLFLQDDEDGVLEQWLISPISVHVIIRAKLIAYWMFYTFPLLLLCPLVAGFFELHIHEVGVLMLSVLSGTPAIFMCCALAASFSTGLKQKGMFMALILLPLSLPVMIWGSGTLTVAMQGLPVSGELSLLLAMSLLAMLTLPWCIAGAIRISMGN
jgi:heme exporter protein B